jgi:hypothetical protein
MCLEVGCEGHCLLFSVEVDSDVGWSITLIWEIRHMS